MSRTIRIARRVDVPVLVLLLAILVVRIVWVLAVPAHALVKDAAFYNDTAHWFLQSGTFAINDSLNPSAWVVPGYSFFLAAMFWLFGSGAGGVAAVRIVQVIFSVLTIWVLYRVALRLGGRRLGIVFIVLAGLYPPFTLANEYILTEVLYVFLLSLTVLIGVRLVDKASWLDAGALGILLAVGAYVRPAGVVWGIVPFLFMLKRVNIRRIAALGAMALVLFCLCMSPWWIRNEHVYNQFVTFTTSEGFTEVRGTYEMFDTAGYDQFLPTMIGKDQMRTARQELDANAYYHNLAMTRLKGQLRHEPVKLAWGRVRAIADSFASPTYPSLSSLSDTHAGLATVVQWGMRALQVVVVLIPAALAVWLRRRDRRVWMLATLPVVVGIAYAAILILPRYVLPVMPIMLLLAAMGWLGIADRLRKPVTPPS